MQPSLRKKGTASRRISSRNERVAVWTMAEAQWNLFKPIYFAANMLESGEVDALVAGIEASYAEVLRPCLQVIGAEGGSGRVAGLHMLAFPNHELIFFADTTVNIEPDATALAQIALQTSTFVRELGIVPRVAMVSFSNFGFGFPRRVEAGGAGSRARPQRGSRP